MNLFKLILLFIFLQTVAYGGEDSQSLQSIFEPFNIKTHKILTKKLGVEATTDLYTQWISSKNIPDQCSELIGSCDYYLCKEQQMKCGSGGYLLGFGFQYCSESTEQLIKKVSPYAKKWIVSTATCLHQQMELMNDQLSCSELKKEAIDSHDKCYSELSFCKLKLTDVTKILKMIKPTLLDKDIIKEGLQVLRHCKDRDRLIE